jgi:excisionase family DNA binding protein
MTMEQYLFNLSQPVEDLGDVRVQPNLWLLTGEEMPPLLFSAEEVARLLHVGRGKVYDLMRSGELRSVKVGGCRRISAFALRDFVQTLEAGAFL